MGKNVFVDGNLLVKSGVFYGLYFVSFATDNYKTSANEIIIPDNNGIFVIDEDYGSMFKPIM